MIKSDKRSRKPPNSEAESRGAGERAVEVVEEAVQEPEVGGSPVPRGICGGEACSQADEEGEDCDVVGSYGVWDIRDEGEEEPVFDLAEGDVKHFLLVIDWVFSSQTGDLDGDGFLSGSSVQQGQECRMIVRNGLQGRCVEENLQRSAFRSLAQYQRVAKFLRRDEFFQLFSYAQISLPSPKSHHPFSNRSKEFH